jgi:hypothetical protein
MADEALANYLAAYTRHTRGHAETDAERHARIDAEEALPPLDKAIASVLKQIDSQVGGNHPESEVRFFASNIQAWGDRLHEALVLEALARQANAPTPAEPAQQEL